MTEYEFETPDGELVDIEMPSEIAPKLGETILIDGVELRRAVSMPGIVRGRKKNKALRRDAAARAGYVVSQSAPKWLPGADGYTSSGRPCYRNEGRYEDHVCKRGADEGGEPSFIDR
jgi:hypothetical protein